MNLEPKIFCAIDTDDLSRAKELASLLAPLGIGLKLGLEFFNANGPQGALTIRDTNPDIPLFMDLKCHDIPNTVAKAIKAISYAIEPAYLNVHAGGGREMMEKAKQACHPSTKLLGVTVLTSMNESDLHGIGVDNSPAEQVQRLAKLTKDSGLDGIVCSSHEIETMRADHGYNFVLMVPGIRPAGSDQGDQKRIMTPKQALELGATHLVIGRPITQADDPAKAANAILEEIG